MIILNRRDTEAKDALDFKFGLKGRFTMQAVKNGEVVRERTFNNLITNNGLNMYGSSGARTTWGNCHVGTGTAAPSVTDTTLAALLASVNWSSGGATQVDNGTLPTPWAQTDIVFLFGIGAVVGNITEIGVGGASNNLFSRALIVDGGGVPVAFPVLADEQLRVTYSFRVYLPTVDYTGTVMIGSTTYNYMCRGRMILNTNFMEAANMSGDSIMPQNSGSASQNANSANSGPPVANTDTSNISGYLGVPTSINNQAYVANNYYREWNHVYGPATGNGNVRTVLNQTNAMSFQTEYTPPIPKANTNTLTLPFRFSWARR